MAADQYLIEILLRARDDASAKIDALQRKVDALRASAAGNNGLGDLERSVTSLGDAAGDTADEHQRHNEQLERTKQVGPTHVQAVERIEEAHADAAEAVDSHTTSHEKLVNTVKRSKGTFDDQAKEMARAEKAAADLSDRIAEIEQGEDDLRERFDKGRGSRREYADGLTLIASKWMAVARAAEIGSKQTDELLANSRRVREEASRIGTQDSGTNLIRDYERFLGQIKAHQVTTAEATRGLRSYASGFDAVSRSFNATSTEAKDFGRSADDARMRLSELTAETRTVTQRTEELDRAQAALMGRMRSGSGGLRDYAEGLKLIQSEYLRLARSQPAGSADQLNLVSRARDVGTNVVTSRNTARGDDLLANYAAFKTSVRETNVGTRDATEGFQRFRLEATRLSRVFGEGSAAGREFAAVARDAGKSLDNIRLAQADSGLERFVARVAQFGDSIGVSVLSLSARLRGFRLVGVVGLIQQLDTAVVGLAGSLVAIAADAAQAGAALGGAFVSGIAQAVPVAAVLLAGLERIKSVIQAVSLSQQIQQQRSFDPTAAAALQLQTAQGLITAQNALVDAYDNVVTSQERVIESQQALTDARVTAIRNITDLTLAEKTASEQATGAKLSLTQAEQQLQALEQTGGTQLQLQQAQLAVREARTGVQQADIAVPRSRADAARARARGVENSTSVQSALLSVRAAQRASRRAPEQVQAAQEELQLARLRAASPAGQESSTQGQLNFLKSQMSAPERLLFNSLVTLENSLKNPSGPLRRIQDAIVAPFARAAQAIVKLLGDKQFVGVLTGLSESIGKGLNHLFDIVGNKSFFEAMAKDATANAPAIFSALGSIAKIFQSIALAAAPLLHGLLKELAVFLKGVSLNDASPEGQKRLAAFFHRAGQDLDHIIGALHAFYDLLKALGRDAAPAGDSVFVGLTNTLKSATDWVNNHGPEVRKFFRDAVDVLGILGGMLVTLAKIMIAVFDSGAMKTFAQFVNTYLIPAIGDVATVLGFVITNILAFFNLFGGSGRAILEGAVAVFVGMLVLNRVADAALGASRGVQALWAAIKVIYDGKGVMAGIKAFADTFHGVGRAAKGAAGDVATAATETEATIDAEGAAIAPKTAVVEAELASMGAGATASAVETGTAATAMETELTVAAPVLEVAATADGAAVETGFAAGLGPVLGALFLAAGAGWTIGTALAQLVGGSKGRALQFMHSQPTINFGSGIGDVALPTDIKTTTALHDWVKQNVDMAAYAQNRRPGANEVQQKYNQVLPQWRATFPGGSKQNPVVGGSTAPPFKAVGATPQSGYPTLSGADNEAKIYNYLVGQGASPNAAAGLLANFHSESGFDPTAQNPGGSKYYPVGAMLPTNHAYGIGQWLGPRATALSNFAKAQGKSPSDLGVQLAFLWSELTGSKSAAFKELQFSKTAGDAASNDYFDFEGGNTRSGYAAGKGDQSLAPRVAWANAFRNGGRKATTPRPPATSTPRPPVSSPTGGGGLSGFTSGGSQTSPTSGPGYDNLFHGATGVQASRVDQGIDYSGITGPIGAIGAGVITDVIQSGSGFDGGPLIIEQLTDGQYVYYALENGALVKQGLKIGDKVSAGQQIATGRGTGGVEFGFSQWAKRGLPITPDAKGVDHDIATAGGKYFASVVSGGSSATGSNGYASAPGSSAPRRRAPARVFTRLPISQPDRAFGAQPIPSLPTFTNGADPSLAIVQIVRAFIALQAGFGRLNMMSERIRPLTTRIHDFVTFADQALNVTFAAMDRNFQQMVTRLTDAGIMAAFRTTSTGDVVSRGVGAADPTIIGGFETEGQGLSTEHSFLTRVLGGLNRQRRAARQIFDPAARRAALSSINTSIGLNQSLLTTNNDAIAQNTQSTFSARQAAVQNLLTRISNRFGTQQSGLQASQSTDQTLGNFAGLPRIDHLLADSVTHQISALEAALTQAKAMGDATMAAQIQQQIDQLHTSVVQYTAQALQDAISQIQQTAGTASGRTSLLSGLAGVATTQGNFSLAGALTRSSLQNAVSSDQNQIAAYQPLLAQAVLTHNVGAIASITQALDGLAADLATNTQALTDNTAATNTVITANVQARGTFQSGVYGAIGGIIQTLGQTTGATDVPALIGTLRGSNNVLQGSTNAQAATLAGYGIDVRGMSTAGILSALSGPNVDAIDNSLDPADQALFESLVNGILGNTEQIATNNQQLAMLNGQLTQPQSFASSQWQSFRDAIFTGMGGLQPAYASSLGLSANPLNPAFTGTSLGGGDTNIHVVTNPVAPEVDPYTQGRQIAFALKTPV